MRDKLVIQTEDTSHTLFNKDIGEHYHSTFGAIQESEHIFIQAGLQLLKNSKATINIFEVGFGTGLNALLTYNWSLKNKLPVSYESVELYPVSINQVQQLNYPELLKMDKNLFFRMHESDGKKVQLSKYFSLSNQISSLQEVELSSEYFDLIYFDAFSPDVQPEMWTDDIFLKIADATKRGGILTTYSCKGFVKRALKAAGFEIEKLPGPKGKREILRAIKK